MVELYFRVECCSMPETVECCLSASVDTTAECIGTVDVVVDLDPISSDTATVTTTRFVRGFLALGGNLRCIVLSTKDRATATAKYGRGVTPLADD